MNGNGSESDVQAALDATSLPEYLEKATRIKPLRKVLAFPRTYANFRYYDGLEILRGSTKVAAHYFHNKSLPLPNGKPSVVAIYAKGSVEWIFTFWALVRLGHTVLALSPRLPAASVNALMGKCGSKLLICGSTPAGPDKIASQTIPMITEDGVRQSHGTDTDLPLVIPSDPATEIAFYIHSSGSTGLPKLIPKTHEDMLGAIPRMNSVFGNMSVYVASAVYNGIGLYVAICGLVRSKPIFYDNDNLDFTAEGYVQLLQEAKPENVNFTPYSLALAASTKEGMEALRLAKNVVTLGAVCPTALGDKLVAEGVRLSCDYGQQEVGVFMSSGLRSADDNDWEYMAPLPAVRGHIDFYPVSDRSDDTIQGERLYEFVVLPTYPGLNKMWVNSDNPPGSLHNGDLFLKHTTKPNRWRLVGRKDDQLKIYANDRQSVVNASYYESTIKGHVSDIVDEVVLFGQGRKKLGLLIFPKPLISEQTALDRVEAAVAESINGILPTPLDKNMLKVVEGDKAPVTNKLNFIRAQVYMKFAEVINEAYATSVLNQV